MKNFPKEFHTATPPESYNLDMTENKLWGKLRQATEVVDVSDDTILRRAVYFEREVDEIDDYPCPEGMVRYKKLKLGKGTRQERRYYLPDLKLWLN